MRLRDLFEDKGTAVMAFGRMNPPTIGHAKLIDAVKSQPGDPYVFLSQSQKPKTDPLAFEDKLRYAKFFFPNITIGNPEVKTIIQALQKIEQLGYKNLIYVAGSDRVASFEELIKKYNGKDYNFDNIQVVSAGERDPDADGAEGMSASKMRQAAADNDIESFKQGVPNQEVADEMFAAVRKGMGIQELEPAESIAESKGMPDKIKPVVVPKFPPAPTQAGETDSGATVTQTKNGGLQLNTANGKFVYDKNGKPVRYSPAVLAQGFQIIYDIKTGVTTVVYNSGGVKVTGKYDKSGNKMQDAGSASYHSLGKTYTQDAVGESVEIPVVNYDRNYGGDINKVLAVKPNARADAEKIYKQLGGISNDNYKKMQELVQAKIQELRKQYQAKAAKDGLKGKDALHSDHFKLFRKQSNDLKIMMASAMDMMVKASGAKPGQIIKPNQTPGYTAKIIGK